LADRLVEEDHAADVVAGAAGREEQVAVGAPVLLGRLDPDRVEALLDRPRALVRREDPLALGDERLRGLVQSLAGHRASPESLFLVRLSRLRAAHGGVTMASSRT
jgi:hypothetical protein